MQNVPSSSSLTSLDMRFSSWRMSRSSSRERATPPLSFSRPPKHIIATILVSLPSLKPFADSTALSRRERGLGRILWQEGRAGCVWCCCSSGVGAQRHGRTAASGDGSRRRKAGLGRGTRGRWSRPNRRASREKAGGRVGVFSRMRFLKRDERRKRRRRREFGAMDGSRIGLAFCGGLRLPNANSSGRSSCLDRRDWHLVFVVRRSDKAGTEPTLHLLAVATGRTEHEPGAIIIR